MGFSLITPVSRTFFFVRLIFTHSRLYRVRSPCRLDHTSNQWLLREPESPYLKFNITILRNENINFFLLFFAGKWKNSSGKGPTSTALRQYWPDSGRQSFGNGICPVLWCGRCWRTITRVFLVWPSWLRICCAIPNIIDPSGVYCTAQ